MLDTLTQEDAAAAARLSAAFGWPHRAEDWATMLLLGHGVAWRDEAGALAGTAMWFPHGPAHGTIGLVQVAPSMQGNGVGRRLMQAVIDQAGARSLALHATEAGAPLYARLGFTPVGRVAQHQGTGAAFDMAEAVPVMPASATAIGSLDAAATGLNRARMLDVLARAGNCVVPAADGAPAGYAIARRFGHGMVIGPVVADDEATARGLIVALHRPGHLRIDVTIQAPGLRQWLTDAGLPPVGGGLLMRRGAWPDPSPSGPVCFGLASEATG
jgi:GNAT superfamily N-acetyltransferase